ncbi:MAG: hypothetical protein GVY30_00180 [Chloroflexi bacterium]|jgi:hypothetical protein|nr:hypothetical protein [Chloroflexota bacterium]
MTTPKVRVIWRNQEVWRFHARSIDRATAEIETQRHLGHPPAPVGSHVYFGEELLGIIRCVKRQPFNRYRLVYDPPREEREETEETEAETAESPKESSEPAGPYLLASLDLDDRILAALTEYFGGPASTSEVSAATDEELLAIKGIGPASLQDIRNAIAGLD